jgi:hypothetical protein
MPTTAGDTTGSVAAKPCAQIVSVKTAARNLCVVLRMYNVGM